MFRLMMIAVMALCGAGAATAQAVDPGEKAYGDYCATCHGAAGKGKGPLAEVMTVPVPDLTQLAKNNDGVFPMLEVIHVIDGRTGVRGHGTNMPVFGALFDMETDAGPYGDPLITRGRVLSLAYYLESIQAQ